MTKAPAFQFYVKDWLSSFTVQCMTPAEEGGYVRLLAYCWDSGDCSLPDDDDTLALMSRLGEGWFKGGSTAVRKCFAPHPDRPGHLTNPRLLAEHRKQQAWRDKSAAGGKKSAAQRTDSATKSKGGSRVVQPHRPTVVQGKVNSSSASSSASSKKEAVASSPPTPMLPEWMPVDAWAAFREMRRSIKSPMTAKAIDLMIQKLDGLRQRGHDPTALLNRSIMNNWKDIYEPKEDHHATTFNSPRPRAEQPTWRSAGDDLAARYAREADREEQAAAGGDPEPRLRLAEGLRQDEG